MESHTHTYVFDRTYASSKHLVFNISRTSGIMDLKLLDAKYFTNYVLLFYTSSSVSYEHVVINF